MRLAPDLPQGHLAMGLVHYFGQRDYESALREMTIAAQGLPGSAQLWSYVGFLHRRLGNWEQVLAAFEKATALDPQNATFFDDLGGNRYRMLHRYRDAIGAYSRALELAPDLRVSDLHRALVYVAWQGRVDSLRVVLRRGPESYEWRGSADLWRCRLALWERDPDAVLAVLDEPGRVTFEGQESYEPGLLYAGLAYRLRGDSAAARTAFDGALHQLDSVLGLLPGDWRFHATRGLVLGALQRGAEARAETAWLKGSAEFGDAYRRGLMKEARALIFAQSMARDDALHEIEQLLSGPSWTSVQTLRLDPLWDPIRDDARFTTLLAKYAPANRGR